MTTSTMSVIDNNDVTSTSTTVMPDQGQKGMTSSAQTSMILVAAMVALVVILGVLNVIADWWGRNHHPSIFLKESGLISGEKAGWFSSRTQQHRQSSVRRSAGTSSHHRLGVNVPSMAARKFGILDFSSSHGGASGSSAGPSRYLSSRLTPRL